MTPVNEATTEMTRVETINSAVCWCDVCTGGEGVPHAVYLCKTCSGVPAAHQVAALRTTDKTASGKKRKVPVIVWRQGMRPSSPHEQRGF